MRLDSAGPGQAGLEGLRNNPRHTDLARRGAWARDPVAPVWVAGTVPRTQALQLSE